MPGIFIGVKADQIGAEQPKTEADVRKIAADQRKAIQQAFDQAKQAIQQAETQALAAANTAKTQALGQIDQTAASASAGAIVIPGARSDPPICS